MDFRETLDPSIYQQLSKESDRGVAIIGSSLVEYSLERLFLARMRELSNKRIEDLFEGFGPLASFAAKIKIGFAFNFYGEKARTDLLTMNSIRNKLAHEIKGFGEWSFAHPDISNLCNKLKLFRERGALSTPEAKVLTSHPLAASLLQACIIWVAS